MPNLICRKVTVGRNYNSTRDNQNYTGKMLEVRTRLYTLKCVDIIEGSVCLKEQVAANM